MVALSRTRSSFFILIEFSIMLLMLVFTSTVLADDASITLEVQSGEVYIGDTITITVDSIGLVDPLDTSILSESARFERETYGTRIFVHNGKVVDVKIRRMEFTATKTGPVVFGPVTSGEINSNSVSVNVLDAVRSEWKPDREDLTIDVNVSEQQPYVHAQVIVDVSLEHQYSIADETIELPEFNGFIVRKVHEERRTFTDQAQQRRQIEWRYLLFPEHSGELIIEPVRWKGTTIKSRPERATFERVSDAVKVSVSPSPLETTEWWLPGRSLEMTETWSSELTALKAGDEVTRVIQVKAKDVLASQIPAPTILESRALSQTLINESREEQVTPNGVIASAEFTYRLNAKSPIPVFLDTVRIPWWDTEPDSAEESIIPARRINVGLPDRADLLKKIAQQSTGTSSFRLWWADADIVRLLMYGLGALLFVPIFFNGLRTVFTTWLVAKRRNSIKQKLRQLSLAQKWDQLGVEIEEIRAFDRGDSCGSILKLIYPALYGRSSDSPDSDRISKLIGSIDLDLSIEKVVAGKLVPL